MKVLIIEDDKQLAESLESILQAKGFDTETVRDGKTGTEYAELGVYDLLILDLSISEIDGHELTRRVCSKWRKTPILVLADRFSLEDRIEAMNAGADYCLTKPLESRELFACINAVFRRRTNEQDEMCYGNTCLDLPTGFLICGENKIRLSSREFDVMRLFLQSREQLLSKEIILSRVWGLDSNAVENHVEVYVGFLRKKLNCIGSNVKIESSRRMGYYLRIAKKNL